MTINTHPGGQAPVVNNAHNTSVNLGLNEPAYLRLADEVTECLRLIRYTCTGLGIGVAIISASAMVRVVGSGWLW